MYVQELCVSNFWRNNFQCLNSFPTLSCCFLIKRIPIIKNITCKSGKPMDFRDSNNKKIKVFQCSYISKVRKPGSIKIFSVHFQKRGNLILISFHCRRNKAATTALFPEGENCEILPKQQRTQEFYPQQKKSQGMFPK